MLKIKKIRRIVASTLIVVLLLLTIKGIYSNIRNARADEETGQHGEVLFSNLSEEALLLLAKIGTENSWSVSNFDINKEEKTVTVDLVYNTIEGCIVDSSTFSEESVEVYISGELASEVNVELLSSGETGSDSITYTLKLSNFVQKSINDSKIYADYSGKISLKIAAGVIQISAVPPEEPEIPVEPDPENTTEPDETENTEE